MEFTTLERITRIKEQIMGNNAVIAKKSKENVRLFDRLISLQNELHPNKKERYDKELASGSWKETEYWKNRNSNNL